MFHLDMKVKRHIHFEQLFCKWYKACFAARVFSPCSDIIMMAGTGRLFVVADWTPFLVWRTATCPAFLVWVFWGAKLQRSL
jgi:hypothetical protein